MFVRQGKLEEQNDLSFLLRRVVESGTVMRMVMFVLVALATIALAAPKKDGKKTGRRGMSAAEWDAHGSNPRENEIEGMMEVPSLPSQFFAVRFYFFAWCLEAHTRCAS